MSMIQERWADCAPFLLLAYPTSPSLVAWSWTPLILTTAASSNTNDTHGHSQPAARPRLSTCLRLHGPRLATFGREDMNLEEWTEYLDACVLLVGGVGHAYLDDSAAPTSHGLALMLVALVADPIPYAVRARTLPTLYEARAHAHLTSPAPPMNAASPSTTATALRKPPVGARRCNLARAAVVADLGDAALWLHFTPMAIAPGG
ncbi:hypothetical protein C8R46DRAFT_1236089 [Mycena filopes]|nr:hypothetical protein C8R46DRAFT_1236089 [Mycena filopes]